MWLCLIFYFRIIKVTKDRHSSLRESYLITCKSYVLFDRGKPLQVKTIRVFKQSSKEWKPFIVYFREKYKRKTDFRITKHYLLRFFKLWRKQDDVLLIDGQIVPLNDWIRNSILSAISYYLFYSSIVVLCLTPDDFTRQRASSLLERVKYSLFIMLMYIYLYKCF